MNAKELVGTFDAARDGDMRATAEFVSEFKGLPRDVQDIFLPSAMTRILEAAFPGLAGQVMKEKAYGLFKELAPEGSAPAVILAAEQVVTMWARLEAATGRESAFWKDGGAVRLAESHAHLVGSAQRAYSRALVDFGKVSVLTAKAVELAGIRRRLAEPSNAPPLDAALHLRLQQGGQSA